MRQMYALRLICVAICILSVYVFLSFKLGSWTLCTLCGSRTYTCNQKKNFTKFTDLNIFPFQQNLIPIFLQQKLHTPYYSSLLQKLLLCEVTIHDIRIMWGVPTMETSKTFFKTSVFSTQNVLYRNLFTLISNFQTSFLILYLFSSVRSLIDYSLLLYYQRH